MLLDLWEWFLLINDGIDLVFTNLASGTYPIPLSFILVLFLFGLISFFAWRSTDIPDLPPAPRPPYVIQITAGPGSGGLRQTIADVRLLSGGTFFDGSEILTRYQNISRNQATNTDSNPQPSTSATALNRNEGIGIRNVSDGTVEGRTVRGRIPGRSLLFGLFRRSNSSTVGRQVPTVPNAIRAQLGSPNLVVYHRVNVYHHHIHSHLGHNSSNAATQPNTAVPSPSNQSQNSTTGLETSTSSSVPPSSRTVNTASTSLLPESSSILETSRLQENRQATNSTNVSNGIEEHSRIDNGGTVVDDRSPISTVHNREVSEDTLQNSNPEILTSSTSYSMPARSGGETNQRRNDGCSSTTYSHHSSEPTNMSSDGDDVRFTIKFLNDTQMDVTSQLSEKIADFKRRHFATEMAENKTVRLIFNGRVLDNDNKTLREFGVFDQCVVHCLIVNRQQNQDQSRGPGMPSGRNNNGNGNPIDGVQGNPRRMVGLPEPGMFFVAFIGIFLIFLWFICLHFGQHLFTQSAVVSLTVLTAIFLIGIVACYLPLPAN